MRRALPDLAGADVPTLVARYREAAVMHITASAENDPVTANRHYDTISSIYQELRSRGIEAQRALLPHLDDIHPAVRVWVSVHALEFAPEQGADLLERLQKRPTGIERLFAKYKLQEWREGTLSRM